MYDRLGPSWEATAIYRARVRGCLLAGAMGDALGYPIEFASLDRIRALHGERASPVSSPASGAWWAASPTTRR